MTTIDYYLEHTDHIFCMYIYLYRIFLGKNSITQIAFGRTPEDEFKDNLRHVSEVIIIIYLTISTTCYLLILIQYLTFLIFLSMQLIEGDVGVLFTSRSPQEVKK